AEWQDQADAIEVWNGFWTRDDRLATDQWDSMLKAGRRLRAVGGTDYHRGEDALLPASLVYADALSTPAILNGMRRGRILLSEDTRGAKVLLTPISRNGGASKSKALPGDILPAPGDGEPVHLDAHITGGNGLFLRVVWATGETVYPVTGADTTLRILLPFPPKAKPLVYVRAELLRGSDKPAEAMMVALTNPLYFSR
ncbi:MAG: CehA/McbA family metallohydrolase, partial [Cytophagales bacterium]|nr:CehA/McbA family metallohydrolase [Armatimonadota bacterium]